MSPANLSSPIIYPICYKQPLKSLYIGARVLLLLGLVPYWLVFYAALPHPRPSWTIKESVLVRVIRWVMPLNAGCGLSPMATDKTREVPEKELKETSFVWIEPADNSHIKGPAADDIVSPVRIPGYIWPKNGKLGKSDKDSLVGLFVHGGGYMMGNASESFPECDIARQISKLTVIRDILSVDYRLTNDASHPAQLQDALAGYCHLVQVRGVDPSRIVIMGACAGGHLALMLARYLYDEKVLPMPRAIMLFSPWVDMAIDKDMVADASISRPNSDVDLLATSYFANLRFLGHKPESLLSTTLLSGNLAPPGSYTNYPRTFISVGDCDAFRRECEQLAGVMAVDGVDVTLDMQPDAVHDFWGFKGVPSDRARTLVAKHVVEWLEELTCDEKD
ncbi:Alpha/Beta hydrolase protein [Crassisporium funariophilum]|nr:Alpha/Beta hydrolase protein [Crassisporium funariophilum]